MSFVTKTDNGCPCKNCINRYVGCHSNCVPYMDWKQQREAKLQALQEQHDINNFLFNTQTSRNKKLKQQGGVKYGRRSNGSNDTR